MSTPAHPGSGGVHHAGGLWTSPVPDTFFPTRFAAKYIDEALETVHAAYRSVKGKPSEVTKPDKSWGKDLSTRELAPLECDATYAMVLAGIELVRQGRFPAIAGEVTGTVHMARTHALYAASAEFPAADVSYRNKDPEHMNMFYPLWGLLLTASLRDQHFCFPAKNAFLALLARPRLGYGALNSLRDTYSLEPEWEGQGVFTVDDYEVLTLPWRCRIGPLHPDDDNDVCGNAEVELLARRIQRERGATTREAARVEAALALSCVRE